MKTQQKVFAFDLQRNSKFGQRNRLNLESRADIEIQRIEHLHWLGATRAVLSGILAAEPARTNDVFTSKSPTS